MRATIGGRLATIIYTSARLPAPSVADFAKQVPADRMWPVGTGEIATLTSEGPLIMAGKVFPAGKYDLYFHVPLDGEWALVFRLEGDEVLRARLLRRSLAMPSGVTKLPLAVAWRGGFWGRRPHIRAGR